MSVDVPAIQKALQDLGVDGWLLYDFRGSNGLARRILKLEGHHLATRRCVYWIPAQGTPIKLVHRIESSVLDHLPGESREYHRWQEFEAGLSSMVADASVVAMEYSPHGGNPYVSRVDAGTIELVRSFGVEVVSSGDLIQLFEAVWDEDQWRMHQEASKITNRAFDVAWSLIAASVREQGGIEESAVQQAILDHFEKHNATTYSSPIVARAEHSGRPHYETGSGTNCRIQEGDLVLIDLWAKLDQPRSIYSDLTRIGFVGETVPEKYSRVFRIVAEARDAGIARLKEAFAAGERIAGAEVDQVVREVIERAGYGQYFTHRTGHSIGEDLHGNGAHLDHLETREDRSILPGTGFSVEPGIYMDEFGIRSEVDVFVDRAGNVHVTGEQVQSEILPILKEY